MGHILRPWRFVSAPPFILWQLLRTICVSVNTISIAYTIWCIYELVIFILGWSADWRSELNGFNPLRMEAVGQVVDILLSWLVESALFLASVLGRPWLVPALLAASVLATGLTVASTSWLVVRDFSKLGLNYFLNCWNRPKIEPNPHIVREVAYIVFCKKKNYSENSPIYSWTF